ncbi:hypothetical protein [Actinotalea sp. JY-7876]|uniref:hypothetical protein n=1 Tax=Actinotalea sp. JY-7876 TaxID=2758442 RepID=UPI0015F53877|nr:hypothetical protein [Actinotalea sp. JY-7876]
MTKRTITVEIELDDQQPDAYTDLVHGLWSVAHLAAPGAVRVVADRLADAAAMNARWDELGKTVPWA